MEPILIGAIVGGIVGLIISIPLLAKQKKINSGKSTGAQNKRFSTTIGFAGNQEELDQKIDAFLTQNKFVKQQYGEGFAYRRGSGTFTASRFIAYSFVEDKVKLDAFVILFGAVESDLEGFTGSLVKKPLKKAVREIVEIISNHK